MASRAIYTPSIDGPLRQGEILSDLIRIVLDVKAGFPSEDDEHGVLRITHDFAIVVSQDCDLDWDHKHRTGAKENLDKELPSILFCEVASAQDVRDRREVNSATWNSIRTNKHERFQFLEIVPIDLDARQIGLPEMTLDFKRCFSLPTNVVYAQLEHGIAVRRCTLTSPYVEHLSSRLAYFQSRVALPFDHQSEPVT